MPTAVDPPTWRRFEAWCLAHDLAPSTAKKSARYLRFFERERGLVLSGLSHDDALRFLAAGREAGTKPKTLNSWVRELNLWSRFNGLGWKMLYFRRRGYPNVQVPTDRMVRQLRDLTWSDRVANARNRALIALLTDQGPRRNEVVHLDLGDLKHTPDGAPFLLVRFGKGEKERELFIDQLTEARIADYVTHYRHQSDARALFTTRTGRLSWGYLGKIVNEAGRRIGIPWLSAHKLRHWTCDSLVDQGVSIPSVAQILGHTDWRTTALYRSRRLQRVRAEEEVRRVAVARFGKGA